MNPILDLFKETLAKDNLTDDDIAQMMREARDLLLMQGANMLPTLTRCLRDKNLQVQQLAVRLFKHISRSDKQKSLDVLRHQLILEERRTQCDNQLLREHIQQMIAELEALPDSVKPSMPKSTGGTNDILLEKYVQVQNMNIRGGYARFQVEFEQKNDVRKWVRVLDEDLIPAMKRVLRHHDIKTQMWGVELCDAAPEKYKPDIIELLQFQLKLEEKRHRRNNRHLQNCIKRMLLELGDNSIAAEALAKLTEEDDYDIRRQEIVTLGREVRQHRDKFIELATHDKDERIRLRAIEQLSKIDDDKELLDLYRKFYEQDSVSIRTWAVCAALKSQLEDNLIYEIALKALDDEAKVMMEVIYALEKRNMPNMVPKLMTMLTEMKTAYVWQVAKGVRAQVLKFGNKPDDWQPLLNLLLNANDSKPAIQSSRWAVSALQGMSDLSAMPVFMSYSKRDSLYEGDPESRPSFTVLRILKNMRKNIEWRVYKMALQPYITSNDEDERLMVARIAVFAGEEDGRSLLRQLRENETSEDVLSFIDQHLPA